MKIWDDYDDCIIGVGTRSGMVDVFIYDKHRMITKLVKRDDMSYCLLYTSPSPRDS